MSVIMEIEKQDTDFIPTIKRIVCMENRVSQEDLVKKTRKREVVQARQIAMYFAKMYTNASLATIGQEIGGKDHTTVLHACKTVSDLSDTERQYRGRLYMMRDKIELAAGVFNTSENDMVCISCGSSKVQSKGWINPNTNEIMEKIKDIHINPLDNYCRTCETNVQLMLRYEYDEVKKQEREQVDTRTTAQIEWDDKLESIKQEFEG